MLILDNLHATYGEGLVLRNVNLEALKGKVTCLVGRNGAGKTTTLKSIMGHMDNPKGDIILEEKSIMTMPPYARAKAGIGYVPQGREIFLQLTVEENLLIGLEAKKDKSSTTIPEEIFTTFPILKEFLHRKGGDLSGGQQQQLAIARAIIAEPKVLILDEPTEGIQPSIIQEIGRVITKLKSDMAILIVEQYLEFVLEIADYCYVMENGRIIMEGKPDELDQEALQATMSL
ncbi:urea ABC transporter ATP-binding subunit UrtE [Anaerosporobacter sp.]|uniref:urea ABC transporter ATP-binding subunit UrtE n=1 Tax=Anaerosporobacter sp. TaxID=1872529 RepID=UPI00286F08F8|nr:urea ABC transporter ATP-binding subunit UrtE [Anaerosporobacter sp.]